MDNMNINSGVVCEVASCQYHTTQNKCTAQKIEVCSCKDCCIGDASSETFCSTYKEKKTN